MITVATAVVVVAVVVICCSYAGLQLCPTNPFAVVISK